MTGSAHRGDRLRGIDAIQIRHLMSVMTRWDAAPGTVDSRAGLGHGHQLMAQAGEDLR